MQNEIDAISDKYLDMQLQSDQATSENKLLQDQIKLLTESNNSYQRKIDEIYSCNILIAKQDDIVSNISASTVSQPEARFTDNVQLEIKKLHKQLLKKEQVIHQLKYLVGKQQAQAQQPGYFLEVEGNDIVDDTMSVLSNRQRFNGTFGAVRGQDGGNGPRKTIKLTKENVEEVKAAENPTEAEEYTGKEYQAFIYQILSDKTRQATEEELDLVAISQIIEPSKLRKYLTMHNELVQDVKKMKEENLEFHTENKSLQDQLTMEMMKNPATETITSARLEYEVRQTEKKKELEMKAIKKDHKA